MSESQTSSGTHRAIHVGIEKPADSALYLLLNYFDADWKPSLLLYERIIQSWPDSNVTRVALMRALQALSSPRLVEFDLSGTPLIDLRMIEKMGRTSSTRYRLTALGEIARQRLEADLVSHFPG